MKEKILVGQCTIEIVSIRLPELTIPVDPHEIGMIDLMTMVEAVIIEDIDVQERPELAEIVLLYHGGIVVRVRAVLQSGQSNVSIALLYEPSLFLHLLLNHSHPRCLSHQSPLWPSQNQGAPC
jgi:hypothetical protein